jgi:hypothetical protein
MFFIICLNMVKSLFNNYLLNLKIGTAYFTVFVAVSNSRFQKGWEPAQKACREYLQIISTHGFEHTF